jgi:hypothetical protein
MRLNFSFSEDYCSFHTSNVIRLNFSKFYQKFSNFLKIDGIDHLRTNFQTLLLSGLERNSPVQKKLSGGGRDAMHGIVR